jgi:serine/threonine protein kinase
LNSTIDPTTGYSKAIDLWSIGIIVSKLLSTKNPVLMYGKDENILKFLKEAGRHGVTSRIERFIQPEVEPYATALIKQLCALEETKRITVRTALKHNWFSSSGVTESKYSEVIQGWKPRKLTVKLTEKIRVHELAESDHHDETQSPSTESFVNYDKIVLEEPQMVQIPDTLPPLPENYSHQDSARKEIKPVQELLAQDMQELGEDLNMLDSIPPPTNWELPPISVETESIQSAQSDRVIRRHDRLPITQRRNLARRNGVRKARKQPRAEMRHHFHRQLNTNFNRFNHIPCLGDGFD